MTGEAALNDEEVFFFFPSKNIWSSSASKPCMTNISVTEKTQVISGKGGRGGTCSRPTSEKKSTIYYYLFNILNMGLEMIYPKKELVQ